LQGQLYALQPMVSLFFHFLGGYLSTQSICPKDKVVKSLKTNLNLQLPLEYQVFHYGLQNQEF
jgi:hypothetical protein